MLKLNPPKFLEILEEVCNELPRGPYEYRHNPSSATMKTTSGRVVGACMRQLYYKSMGEPESEKKEFTNRLQAGFGNAIHDWITIRLAKSKKISIIPESAGKVFVDGLSREVSFRLDGLVTHKGEIGCLEIKTVQGYGLQRMIKEGGPKESDLLQVLCYFATNENIKWTSLVYVARDSGYRAEYHVWKDDAGRYMYRSMLPEGPIKMIDDLSFDAIKARWAELEANIVAGTIPARDYKVVFNKEGIIVDKRVKLGVEYKSHFRCMYCPYTTTCWSGDNAKRDAVQIPQT